MKTRVIVTLLSIALTAAPASAQQPGRERILRIDAVELIERGREVEGKLDFKVHHGKYDYLFANAENAKQFESAPAKYEIQQGGACGRMGPLSGEGSPKLFAVHDGKLYIFASEQCRRSFVAAPASTLEVDDAPPVVTEESQQRGRAIIDRAVAHLGGPSKFDAITSYREQLARTEESGGKSYAVSDTVTLLLPDGVRHDNCWNEDCWGSAATSARGWFINSDGSEDSMVEVQQAALRRGAGRHPLALLRQRDLPGFIASDAGRRTLVIEGGGEEEVSLVTVHRDGATTTVGVDAAGRVRFLAYRGRGPGSAIGAIEKVFSAFHDVNGHELPGRVDVTFNGKPARELSGAFAVQAINDPADAVRFQ